MLNYVYKPDVSNETTGVPQAIDSNAVNPNDSIFEGTTVTFAAL